MHRTVIRCAAVTAICLASAVAQASAPAKTPEELIRNLVAAAQQGNTEEVMANLTSSSRKALSDAFAHESAMQTAQQAFQQALDEKFGKGGKLLTSPADDLKTSLSRLAGAEVLESKPGPGGSAHLRVRTSLKFPDGKNTTREETLLARKEGGEWKLVIGFPPTKADSKTVFARLTKEVMEGQFKDRNAAMIALANATLESGERKGATK